MPDFDFNMPCGVVVFYLFYCRLDFCCGECYFGSLQLVCFAIYMYVCVMCFMFDCVGELFVEWVCCLCGWGEYIIFESYCVVFGLCYAKEYVFVFLIPVCV